MSLARAILNDLAESLALIGRAMVWSLEPLATLCGDVGLTFDRLLSRWEPDELVRWRFYSSVVMVSGWSLAAVFAMLFLMILFGGSPK